MLVEGKLDIYSWRTSCAKPPGGSWSLTRGVEVGHGGSLEMGLSVGIKWAINSYFRYIVWPAHL